MNEWHKLVEQNKREYVRAHVEPEDNTSYAAFVIMAFVTIVLMVMGLYVAFPYGV